MSQRLSTSTTFQSLETRVDALEQLTPLSATLENNSYLSAKRHDGVVTRVAGITPGDALYFGGIDAALNSIVITLGAATAIELNALGASISGPLTISTELHAPTILAPSANGFGGSVKVLGSGVAGYTGIVEFLKLDGTRNGYVGFNAESGPMHYGSDTGAGHYFEGGIISPDPAMLFGLRFNSVDGIVDFDAGDYLYYSRSNDEYLFMIGGSAQLALGSGGLQVSNVFTVGDGDFGMSLNGSSPYIAFDSTDFLGYNRSSNIFSFNIGGSSACNITATGMTANGLSAPTISVDANFYLGMVSSQPRILWDATDSLQYDRTTNALTTYIGGAAQFAVNPSGTFVANVLTIGDGNFAVNLNGGMPTFQFDGGDYIQFNRSSNAYAFNIGAATKAALDSSGNFTAAGSIAPSNDANFLLKTTSANPQIVFDSGGDQISYDRTANKYYFAIGGVNVASIDASGNMRLKGTLTQSVTP